MPIRRRKGGGGEAPATGPTQEEQSQAIVEEIPKPPVRRLDPSQVRATVQVLDPITDDALGIGELRLTGSAVKSATFNQAAKVITVNLVPRFDYTIDFGLTEKSVS